MFVRWKIRRVSGHPPGYVWGLREGATRLRKIHLQELTPYVLLSAQLVESVRMNGRVRQRVVRHVGSLREDATTTTEASRWFSRDRRYFWRRADAILATLPAELAPRIADSLAARVPRLTPAELRPLADEARQSLQLMIAAGARPPDGLLREYEALTREAGV
jgi:hypothetical protein